MTFKIDVPFKTYAIWNCWGANPPNGVLISDATCVITPVNSPTHGEVNWFRTFTFESEEHYHWFLLQQ